MHIALVGCAQTKRQGFHPAKDLYNSILFRKAFDHASQCCSRVFILSAKYGLLHPETVICDYDLTLNNMGALARKNWGDQAFAQIQEAASPHDDLYFFCGRLYREALPPTRLLSYTCHVPLQGLSIGKQLQWYKQNTPA